MANWYGQRCTESHDDCSSASSVALCVHGTCHNVPRSQPGQVQRTALFCLVAFMPTGQGRLYPNTGRGGLVTSSVLIYIYHQSLSSSSSVNLRSG